MKMHYKFKGQIVCMANVPIWKTQSTIDPAKIDCKKCRLFIDGFNRRGPRGIYTRKIAYQRRQDESGSINQTGES